VNAHAWVTAQQQQAQQQQQQAQQQQQQQQQQPGLGALLCGLFDFYADAMAEWATNSPRCGCVCARV
jgi:hypothetical protein